MDTLIVARGLAKTYGRGGKRAEAVRGIDLDIRRGEIFGLVGPDGAGKTTTIQMLCGILNPSSGSATVAGVDVARDVEALGGKIGYMSEGFTLYGSLSVEENLDFFAELYRVPPNVAAERKEQLLRFARLEEARHRRAERLSGGMQKKLALACTLVYRPLVLFLDEPTTGVDPVSRQDFWKILYEFLAEGISVFISTPYMDEAERCNRVALMRQGQIIACDKPATLKSMVTGTAIELNAQPQAQAVAQLRAMPFVTQAQVFGERLHLLLRDGENAAQRLSSELSTKGIVVTDLKTASPSLEDVFIAVIEAQHGEETARLPRSVRTVEVSRDERVVQADGLTRRFGSFTAVDRASFTIRRGTIFGFLGPNGSGKTTTIRMLCGLLEPSAGKASVAGLDVARDRVAMKARIGYMSQKFSLYNDLTVDENIRFYADVYGLSPARLVDRRRWVLNMAGLVGKEHLLARDLSGGWKQRLALGCAILHEPGVLFLDEPTSGVDPASRRQFWDLIFELTTQGTTIFVTTHYMDEAEHCHDLALIYRGRIIARGSPEQLRANMKLGILIEIPVHDPLAALAPVEALPEVIQTSIFGDRLHALVWDAEDGRAAIEQALSAHELMTGAAQPVPLALEDLFTLFVEMDETGREARQNA